jgi:DNA invertase Pin-like site-specific DNA recombinase
VIVNPQVGTGGNSRRKSTSKNGPSGSFRQRSSAAAAPRPPTKTPVIRSDALLRRGVDHDNIHVDVGSGAKASRPKLDLVMQLLREGDTLKVTRLDRLSRSVLHLVTLGAELRERGIGLHVIEQGIDTVTMEGRARFGMLSVLAELQRELIVANTNDGLASARARGRVGGRRPRLTADRAALAQRLYDEREKTVQQIADMFGVPRSTVYGHLNKAKTVPRQPKKNKVTKP